MKLSAILMYVSFHQKLNFETHHTPTPFSHSLYGVTQGCDIKNSHASVHDENSCKAASKHDTWGSHPVLDRLEMCFILRLHCVISLCLYTSCIKVILQSFLFKCRFSFVEYNLTKRRINSKYLRPDQFGKEKINTFWWLHTFVSEYNYKINSHIKLLEIV